ncbi:MAG: hypothetical protein IJT41_01015 [Clostridia bacterium]|nr:hypothetical protein [Clostridia bacterium]
MIRNIGIVRDRFGQPELVTLADMLGCMRLGFGHLDYLTFGFAQNHGENRKTFMTMGDNIRFARQMNDPSYCAIFLNKIEFNRMFRAFIGREYMQLSDGAEAFRRFIQRHPVVFAKTPDSYGGKGIRKVDLTNEPNVDNVYRVLLRDGLTLIEEPIAQHEKMQLLCDACVNTLRIVTVLDDDGQAHVVYTLLRVGDGDSPTDNVSSGGMYTMPDANGKIIHPMFCDRTGKYYSEHPKTVFAFLGFEIPFYAQAVELCAKAALVEPHVRYVGWDVAVTAHGPVLVEGNTLPGYDMCQNYRFHTDGRGMKSILFSAVYGK